MFSHMIMLIFAQIDAAPAYDVKPIVIRYHGNRDKSCCMCFALDSECAAAFEIMQHMKSTCIHASAFSNGIIVNQSIPHQDR